MTKYGYSPFVEVIIELDPDEKITRVVQTGDSQIAICLAVLSLIGGLYKSLSALLRNLVRVLTSIGLITSITKNLFYF
jgi:uncharacterized membrane protein YccF (DUF307 family)